MKTIATDNACGMRSDIQCYAAAIETVMRPSIPVKASHNCHTAHLIRSAVNGERER